MGKLESYANKYKTIRMERRNGILQMTLHTDGGSLRWGVLPHGELPEAFHYVGSDYDNRGVIITGTGNQFAGARTRGGGLAAGQAHGSRRGAGAGSGRAAAPAVALSPPPPHSGAQAAHARPPWLWAWDGDAGTRREAGRTCAITELSHAV